MRIPFHRKNVILLVSLALAYPSLRAAAPAGVAQFTTGDATIRRGSESGALVRGRQLESGDSISTGPDGQAQVRFTDGSIVALRANSQFKITEYADTGDPKTDKYFVDFLRGGMRTITGLIGKRGRENYKVTTSTATIGIRGSAFNVEYNSDGSLLVSGEKDEIEVCTVACIGLKQGETARVVSNAEPPFRTNQRVSLKVPEPRQEPGVVANEVRKNGLSAVIDAIPPSTTSAPTAAATTTAAPTTVAPPSTTAAPATTAGPPTTTEAPPTTIGTTTTAAPPTTIGTTTTAAPIVSTSTTTAAPIVSTSTTTAAPIVSTSTTTAAPVVSTSTTTAAPVVSTSTTTAAPVVSTSTTTAAPVVSTSTTTAAPVSSSTTAAPSTTAAGNNGAGVGNSGQGNQGNGSGAGNNGNAGGGTAPGQQTTTTTAGPGTTTVAPPGNGNGGNGNGNGGSPPGHQPRSEPVSPLQMPPAPRPAPPTTLPVLPVPNGARQAPR